MHILLCGRFTYNGPSLYEKNVTKRLGYFIFCTYIFLIAVCRYNVGYDYAGYYNYLVAVNSWADTNFELIPRYIMKISRYFHAPWLFFLTINGLILILVLSSIEKESTNIYESITLFITLFFTDSLCIVRQWLAMAFLLYGFKFIKQKRFFPYLVTVIIATMCHTSAIISIFIFFIYNYIPVTINIIVSLFGLLFGELLLKLVFSYIPFLSGYYSYFESKVISGGTKAILIWYLIYFFSIFVYLKTRRGNNKKIEPLISIICYSVVFPRILGPTMGSRMSDYFNIYYIFLLPMLFDKLKPIELRKFYMIPFYLYYLLFFYIDSCNSKGYTNYIFYFLKDF